MTLPLVPISVHRIQGDFGQRIKVRVRNLSLVGATLAVIECRRPDNRTVSWTAAVDAQLGELVYTLQANDLPVSGPYRLQARIQFGSSPVTAQYRTQPAVLQVGKAEAA